MTAHTAELPTFVAPTTAPRVVVGRLSVLSGAVLLAAASMSMSASSDASDVVASLGRRASHDHRYHAEVVATTPLATGVRQRWTVRLTRRGHRPVAGARLTVKSWSPETGEVSAVAPRARYVGRGRYRIDDVYFAHAGWWNVALVIDAATGTDSVAFNVVLPAAARR